MGTPSEVRRDKLYQRALLASQLAIGKMLTVKRWKDSDVTVSGRIVSCEPVSLRRTRKTVVQQFKIVLACEVPKRQLEFVIERLPR